MPPAFLDYIPSARLPALEEVKGLALKGCLYTNKHSIILLARKPTKPPSAASRPGGRAARLLNDEPIRIYVQLLTRLWIMQACHADASCHLSTVRTLSILERLYWWIGMMNVCAKLWIRHYLPCQARKSSRQTVRWPILSLLLPSGPGISVNVDYYSGPLPASPRGNACISLFTDRFSRRAHMFAVTAAEFTVEGTADIFVNRYIPLRGCPSVRLLRDNGLQYCSKLSQAVYKRLGVRKLATSAHHPYGNGSVERVKHTMAQTPSAW